MLENYNPAARACKTLGRILLYYEFSLIFLPLINLVRRAEATLFNELVLLGLLKSELQALRIFVQAVPVGCMVRQAFLVGGSGDAVGGRGEQSILQMHSLKFITATCRCFLKGHRILFILMRSIMNFLPRLH